MKDASVWKPLLQELLEQQPIEPAARLRHRLVALGELRGLGTFSHVELGYRRFKDFLEGFPDVLEMRVREGGDMVVVSRDPAASVPLAALRTKLPALSSVRDDVWIAFSNPDPRRLRFFNRKTGDIQHFLQADYAPTSGPTPLGDWARIDPASGAQQSEWMKEFIAQTQGLDASDFPMIEEPYRTSVNSEFTKALGTFGKQWIQFRTAKMFEVIVDWANRANVDVSTLVQPSHPVREPTRVRDQMPMKASDCLSAKERALKLIESLTEEEVATTLIPLMASIIMVNARR